MTRDEFKIVSESILRLWPERYNIEHFKLLWAQCCANADLVEALEGIAKTAKNAYPTSLAHIIEDIKDEIRKRKPYEAPKDICCSKCLGTGMVSTKDHEDNGFVFRCVNCDTARNKGLSLSIPAWDMKYVAQGFRVLGRAPDCGIRMVECDASAPKKQIRLMDYIKMENFPNLKDEDDGVKNEDIPF